MLFNSLQFFVFFPFVVGLYFLLPHRYRWALLLAASYYFYMAWKAEYVVLLLFSTVLDYWVGLQIGKTVDPKKRKKFLLISIFANLGVLFAFKYFNFFNDSLRAVLNHYNIFYGVNGLKVLLPIGISFYTFQAMSYTIDVYRGRIQPERHLGIFALYVSFFPQLVAGPIERAKNLLPQFYERFGLERERVAAGLRLMLWGFFKKIVIADNIAGLVNHVYSYPTQFQGLPLLISTILFSFQIYCDFSGYSDIAIGAAKVMGFRLMDNFNRPYAAKSVAEFWQRWHISLSTWFRDYLYIPLGGNRVRPWRWRYNIIFVFLVSGLWHGANWTFVIWGLLHGLYFIFSAGTKDFRQRLVSLIKLGRWPRVYATIQAVFIFSLVTFSYIFFRADSIADAWYIVSHLFSGLGPSLWRLADPSVLASVVQTLGVTMFEFVGILAAIAFMEIVHFTERHGAIGQKLVGKPLWLRWGVYSFVLAWILFFGDFGEQPFIYFQF